MWLAPFTRFKAPDEGGRANKGTLNTIKLFFENPVCVSFIRFWNYAKNTERGVN